METLHQLTAVQQTPSSVKSQDSYAHQQDKNVDTKHLLDLLNEGIWDWNLQTNEMVYSEQFQKLLGYEHGAFSKKIEEWFTKIHPSDAKETLEKMRACVEGEQTQFVDEHRIQCLNGEWKSIHVRGVVVAQTIQGRPARLQGLIREVTLQEVKTQLTYQSHLILSTLSNQLPNIIFFQFQRYPGGRCVFPFASESIEQIHGVKLEEIADNAAALFETVHSDDIDAVRLKMKESAQTLQNWHLAYRIQLEKQERFLTGDAFPIKQNDDSIIWYGYLIDDSSNYYRQLHVEQIQKQIKQNNQLNCMGQFEVGIEAGTTIFTKEFAALLGISFEYINRFEDFWAFFWSKSMHPDDVSKVKDAAVLHFKSLGAHPLQVECRLRAANGDWRWISVAAMATKWNQQGKALYLIGSMFDITDKKKIEQERRHFEDILRSGRDRYRHLAGELELLLTHTPVGIMLVHNGKILRANSTLATLFQYRDSKAMLGMSIPDLHQSEESYQQTQASVQQRLKQEGMAMSLCNLKKSDGTIFKARISGKMLPLEPFAGASVWVIEEWEVASGGTDIGR